MPASTAALSADIRAANPADTFLAESLGVAPVMAEPSPALPDSAATTLPKGAADTVGVQVTNTGTSPEEYVTDWDITPFLTGPDGVKGYKPVNVSTTMTATAVASIRPRRHLQATCGSAPWIQAPGVTPYVVQAGQTATIPVTITPSAAVGTTVQGTLYLDDLSPVPGATFQGFAGIFPEGSDVASFSYEYKVGPPAP